MHACALMDQRVSPTVLLPSSSKFRNAYRTSDKHLPNLGIPLSLAHRRRLLSVRANATTVRTINDTTTGHCGPNKARA
jgi:hypothetical protein